MLESLLDALNFSPNNIPLKLQVAKLYLEKGAFLECEKQLTEIIALDSSLEKVKYELAYCFYKQQKISAAEVILDEISTNNIKHLELKCYCFLSNENYTEAQEIYKTILEINPSYTNESFDEVLRASSTADTSESYDEDGIQFMNKPNMNFSDIGGMDKVKKEISLKIIKPLEHQELYKAYGKKTGGGILLYGPPGCGKTYLAKATAGEINANFINVGINEILDMWIGSSERNLHEIFETARKNKPCVIFIDEVDALGANRNDMNKSAGRTVINQFLAELDGIDADNDGILIIGATNAPWYLDPAFRRPGRFDRIIFVAPPDTEAKSAIFNIHLKDKPTEIIDYQALAKAAKSYSGADIQSAIDVAIEVKLEESFADGIPRPLTTKELLKAIKKTKSSTKEWFSSAKNYALYANDGGIYDEILNYLKITK